MVFRAALIGGCTGTGAQFLRCFRSSGLGCPDPTVAGPTMTNDPMVITATGAALMLVYVNRAICAIFNIRPEYVDDHGQRSRRPPQQLSIHE